MKQEFPEEDDSLDVLRNTVHTLQTSLPKLVIDLHSLKSSALKQGSISKPIAYLECGRIDYLKYILNLRQYIENLPDAMKSELRDLVAPLSVFLYHELRQRQTKEVYIDFLAKVVKHNILPSAEEVDKKQYFNTKHVISTSRHTYDHLIDFLGQQEWLSVMSVVNQNFVFDIKRDAPPKVSDSKNKSVLRKACDNVELGQGTSSFSFIKTLKITNDDSILSMKFTPDNRILLAASSRSVIYKWDMTGRPTSAGEPGPANPPIPGPEIGLVHDEDFTFEAGPSERSYVELRGHTGPVYCVDTHRDGVHGLSASYDSTVILWNLYSNSIVCKYTGHSRWPVYHVVFSPVSPYFCTTSHDTTARFWQTDTLQPLRVFAGHEGPVTRAEFHPNGSYVVTASEDKSCRMWDVASGSCVRVIPHKAHISALCISPNGKIIVCALLSGDVVLLDIATAKMVRQYHMAVTPQTNGYHGNDHKLEENVISSAIFLHENTLATGSAHGGVMLWDTRLHSRLHTKPIKHISVKGKVKMLSNFKAGLLMVGVL